MHYKLCSGIYWRWLVCHVVFDCQLGSSQSKVIVFLSTQDSVDFHHLLLSDCLRSNSADTATDAQLQLFKLHGDLPQKVNRLCVMSAVSAVCHIWIAVADWGLEYLLDYLYHTDSILFAACSYFVIIIIILVLLIEPKFT